MTPGARLTESGSARFNVWGPRADRVRAMTPDAVELARLDPIGGGWFAGTGSAVDGTLYYIQLDDGALRPDPASLHQPNGVHGASAIVDLSFEWHDDAWTGIALAEHIVYELHIGTFTDAGTFDAAATRLDHLVDLGVTTVELMPVAQCPGTRNWGYDGVGLYAVQASYGGPKGLQRFVDACHAKGLAVWMDVVYNHLGPEGNYLPEFGPYLTDRHHTLWGNAVNLDGSGSEHVQGFFIDNARMWARDFHVDGFRLDAIHAFVDDSEVPFLQQLAAALHQLADELGRPVHVVAENGLNDPELLVDVERGGLGFDAAWNDDFHHAVHVALTGENTGYYAAFQDAVEDLTTAVRGGYVRGGGPYPYRGGARSGPGPELSRDRLVVFSQNHDQIGNRGEGDRLTTFAPPAADRLAAGLVLLSPWIPMLFMGEEWAETHPFLYFVDHGDANLIEAVRRGRSEEFSSFLDGDVPDPASPATRDRSVLDWSKLGLPPHASVLTLHKQLIDVRKSHPSISDPRPEAHDVRRSGSVITVTNRGNGPATHAVFNVSPDSVDVEHRLAGWRRLVDGADERFGGDGAASPETLDDAPLPIGPWGFVLYREEPH